MISNEIQNGKDNDDEEKYNEDEFFNSVFKKFDKNKSGGVDMLEMTQILENEDDVPSEVSKIVFDAADINKDGVLDPNEFQHMVKDKTFKPVFSRYINTYVQYVVPRKKHGDISLDYVDGVYEEHYTWWPPPIMLIIISAIEITFFVLDNNAPAGMGYYSKLLIYDPFRRDQAWRFLSYTLVHVGYTHLTINVIVQLILGFPLEMVHKWRVLIVYFSGVIAGSLGTSVIDSRTYLAGASGGAYALITGHMGTIFMNWKEMEFPAVQLGVFIFIIAFDIGNSVYTKYIQGIEDNVSYIAHISGAIAGLLVGIWTLKNFEPSKRETYLWWCALTVYIVFMGTMILLNAFWKQHFLSIHTNGYFQD